MFNNFQASSGSQSGPSGLYDESMYRLLPPGVLAHHPPLLGMPNAHGLDLGPGGACFGMSEDELQREYAVVLDALQGGSCCLAPASGPQIASESHREHTASGIFF